jgi:hypothetical protein
LPIRSRWRQFRESVLDTIYVYGKNQFWEFMCNFVDNVLSVNHFTKILMWNFVQNSKKKK